MAQTKKRNNEEKRGEEAVERKTKIIKSKDTASIKNYARAMRENKFIDQRQRPRLRWPWARST